MSSTNKTDNLRLNSWVGSDVPQMADFNSDNAILDNAVATHTQNSDIHITAEEREKWNNTYKITTYYGNGYATRNITLNVDFNPRWGILFGVGKLSAMTDFDNGSNYNYFAMITNGGSMNGASLIGSTLSVQQSPTPVSGNEYRSFNELGVTYICIVFA